MLCWQPELKIRIVLSSPRGIDFVLDSLVMSKVGSKADFEYWVYIDDPTNRVRVHVGSCRYCNHGKGVNEIRLPNNRWEGPFSDPDHAATAAVRGNRRDTKPCGHCLPDHRIEGHAIEFVRG